MNWVVLERYAQWKQRKFPLLKLPEEILEYIGLFLMRKDLLTLVQALGPGWTMSYECPRDTYLVPPSLRPRWLLYNVLQHMDEYINSISDECFFFATSCTQVQVFLDWSPFKSNDVVPVATFEWVATSRPRAKRVVYDKELMKYVYNSAVQRIPYSQVSVYKVFRWSYGRVHMDSHPCFLGSVRLIPFHVTSR